MYYFCTDCARNAVTSTTAPRAVLRCVCRRAAPRCVKIPGPQTNSSQGHHQLRLLLPASGALGTSAAAATQ